MNDEDIAAEIEASPDELQAWRSQIEAARTTDRNFWYKIYISVSRRYRALDEVINYARKEGYKILVHADSDLYVRSDLSTSALIDAMRRHDVGFYVNDSLTSLLHIRKVLGAFLCFNLEGSIDPFVDRWMSEIDRVPFVKRWKGFGQSVLWYTKNSVEGVRMLDLNSINDRFSYSRRFNNKADMWFGSNSKLRFFKLQKKLGLHALFGRAESSRSRCWKDLEAQRNGA
jgi:hypothetical protein